jgi:hypothetical protein
MRFLLRSIFLLLAMVSAGYRANYLDGLESERR